LTGRGWSLCFAALARQQAGLRGILATKRSDSGGGKKGVDGSILAATVRRPRKQGFTFEGICLTPSAKESVTQKEFDNEFGGRIVRRPQQGSESDHAAGKKHSYCSLQLVIFI